jgi:hypothetical protein
MVGDGRAVEQEELELHFVASFPFIAASDFTESSNEEEIRYVWLTTPLKLMGEEQTISLLRRKLNEMC